jgi:hypothetical protein
MLSLLLARFFITTSRDMTARLFTLEPLEGFRPKTFAGHRDGILNAYFSADSKTVSCIIDEPRMTTDTCAARYIPSVVMVLYSRGEPNLAYMAVTMRTIRCPKSLWHPRHPLYLRTIPSPTLAGESVNDTTSTKPTLE